MKRWTKPMLAVLIVIVLGTAVRMLHLEQELNAFRGWVAKQGLWGPLIFAAVYVAATVLALPGSALTVMAGALFGSLIGVATVICGATAGASLCFLIARYFARGAVAASLSKSEKFQKLERLTEKNGALIVALTRLIPLFPFNVLNYGFGLTKVRFRTYVAWSALCMLPGTILYVVGTDALTTALSDGRIPWSLVGVVVLVLGILTLVARRAKRAFQE